jgi:hypothetical protein
MEFGRYDGNLIFLDGRHLLIVKRVFLKVSINLGYISDFFVSIKNIFTREGERITKRVKHSEQIKKKVKS